MMILDHPLESVLILTTFAILFYIYFKLNEWGI